MAIQVEQYRIMLRAYKKARRNNPDFRAEEPVSNRPKTRRDCLGGQRPCPFLGCRYNLLLDVTRNGGLRHRDGLEKEFDPDDIRDSCALDVADRGGVSRGEMGRMLSCTHELIRLEEEVALAKLRAALPSEGQLGVGDLSD